MRSRRNKPVKAWKQFEQAVAAFVTALDPTAVVKHDVRLPDRDTGRPRQRDVWVEAKVCNIFPVRVLISCKRFHRKLNEQDIDAFLGELASSGAHKGVLYTFTGYTHPAIEKAAVRGISCCKLYQAEPPNIPEHLFLSFYCCTPSYFIELNKEALDVWGDETVAKVLSMVDSSGQSAANHLAEAFWQAETSRVEEASRAGVFPDPWTVAIELQSSAAPQSTLVISLHGRWRIYRAKLEGYLLNGTYSFTEEKYIGGITSPPIDRLASEPGPGWELITDPPRQLESGIGVATFYRYRGAIKETILEEFGTKKLREII